MLLESLQAVHLLYYHIHCPQRFLFEVSQHPADVDDNRLVVDRLRLLFVFALDDLSLHHNASKINSAKMETAYRKLSPTMDFNRKGVFLPWNKPRTHPQKALCFRPTRHRKRRIFLRDGRNAYPAGTMETPAGAPVLALWVISPLSGLFTRLCGRPGSFL